MSQLQWTIELRDEIKEAYKQAFRGTLADWRRIDRLAQEAIEIGQKRIIQNAVESAIEETSTETLAKYLLNIK